MTRDEVLAAIARDDTIENVDLTGVNLAGANLDRKSVG